MGRIKTKSPTAAGAPAAGWDRAGLTPVDVALLLVVLIWGTNFVVMKWVFLAVEPLAFNAVRMTLGALVLLGVLLVREGWRPVPRPDWPKLVALGLLGNTLYQIPFVTGLQLIPPGNSALLIATIPVWTALLARALGWERVPGRVWLGIGLSFVGVGLVTLGTPAALGLDRASLGGHALTLAAAACWAGYTVLSKDLLKRHSPLRVSALGLLIGVAGLWPFSIPSVARTPWPELPGGVWAAAFYSGVFPIAVAYVIWAQGVQRVGAARTAIYNNLVPVVTFLLAYVALDQPITPLQGLGGAVTLAGVYFTTATRATPTNTP